MSIPELYRRWRKYSTSVLAVLATALLLWSTVFIFDVPAKEVLAFLAVCIVGVGGIMLVAFGASWVLAKVRSRK
ncbi:hypothetical protein [Litorivivens sp.]|uniref:hypothetical protein n=1 Tax=Litorivivens sp. TaxID=2020868 RepID=UPI0035636863